MVNTILSIAGGIMLLSILVSLVRFILGRTNVDRVVAFDVMTVASIAFIGLLSYLQGRIIYLDVALVYGLLSFLAVIIIAKYFEKSL